MFIQSIVKRVAFSVFDSIWQTPEANDRYHMRFAYAESEVRRKLGLNAIWEGARPPNIRSKSPYSRNLLYEAALYDWMFFAELGQFSGFRVAHDQAEGWMWGRAPAARNYTTMNACVRATSL